MPYLSISPNQQLIVHGSSRLQYRPGFRSYHGLSFKNVAPKNRFQVVNAYLLPKNDELDFDLLLKLQESFEVTAEVGSAIKLNRGLWAINTAFYITYHPVNDLSEEVKMALEENDFELFATFYDNDEKITIGLIVMSDQLFKVIPNRRSRNIKSGKVLQPKEEQLPRKEEGCEKCNLIDLFDEPEPQSNDRPVNPFSYWNDFPISRFNSRNPFNQN